MKVLLANPRGFCAGVNMAIDCVDAVLGLRGPPIYVYHEIVHNRHVVQSFVDRGVRFVDAVDEVPEGSTLIFSAHGVSPAVRRQAADRGLVQIDATCPLVAKVHAEAISFARRKFAIVLIGHRDHDEIVGTLGEAPDAIRIVETIADVDRLDLADHDDIAYLTQTTLSVSDARAIIAALVVKYPHVKAPRREDICYATTNRQHAVRELAGECDVVLVVGSQNSSNSRRLVETAEACGVPGFLIDDADELNDDWLRDARTVLLTAGASAPEHRVQEVLARLVGRFGATAETRSVTSEDVSFERPVSLRVLISKSTSDELVDLQAATSHHSDN